jgi:hypothetical protein
MKISIDATLAKSSTDHDPVDGRFRGRPHVGCTRSRSLHVHEITNSASISEQVILVSSRQHIGTTGFRAHMEDHLRAPLLQRRDLGRLPSRITPEYRVLPLADPVILSDRASHGPLVDACQYPSLTTFISRCCEDRLNSPKSDPMPLFER